MIKSKTYTVTARLLQIFDSLPRELIEKYFSINCDILRSDLAVTDMIYNRRIYCDDAKWCSMYKGVSHNIAGACAFSIYMHMNRSSCFRLDRAEYPMDYIFEIRDVLFELINYSDRGLYKLNYRLHKNKDQTLLRVIPIIMFINEPPVFVDKSVLPNGEYITACVQYDGQLPSNVTLSIEGEGDKEWTYQTK